MKIGFIGLGKMGTPIATNLVQTGFSLKAYNRTATKANTLKDMGALVTDSPEDAARDVDMVITMLSDDAAVKEVSEKMIPAMKPGSIHLSMSTISPSTVELLHPLHDKHRVHYLASPVMGRPPAAASRSLYVLLSGNSDAKKTAEPVLKIISQRVFDFGEQPTTGHAVKLGLNMMIFTILELLSEVFLFAEKKGIDKSALTETLNNTMFAAPVFKTYGSLLLQEQDVPDGFTLKLANKDLRLLRESAAVSGVKLPLADLIATHFDDAISSGRGEKDISAMIGHLRSKLNLS